ncbi:hypothetical protein LOD99_5607 [Oopsacas minuta]|uniref:Uncharacterized protein n=1 Tax=Oopsacas minuta TaxID=111878 RepID=A0AAV7JQ34_9METZ|nr:hypothetical protein LOD99_5607 [Oopsacas minuta]
MSDNSSPNQTHPAEVDTDLQEYSAENILSLQRESAQLRSQLSSYQEQVYQHSLTIVALEEKLVASLSPPSDASIKPEEICKKDKHTITDLSVIEALPDTTPDITAVEQKDNINDTISTISPNKVDDSQIRYLRKQLYILSARLEESNSRLHNSTALNEKLQQALQLKTSIVAQQYTELVELRKYLPQVRSALSNVEDGVTTIATNLSTDSDSHTRISPLIELAVKCTQDGHMITIEKQAQAIATLRVEVAQLEQANKVVPTHREALTEVARVREELRRACLALEGSDISYLMEKKQEEHLKLTQQLNERSDKLEQEKEALQIIKEIFHNFDSQILELILMLSSKFYKLYRFDFKLGSNMTQQESESELESRKRQIEVFSSKLDEYEEEILSRQPAADEEKAREIDKLNQILQGHESKFNQLREEIFSLNVQKELLEKEKLYTPKKDRIHSCLFTKEMVDTLIQDEKKRFNFIMKKKNKEIAILRKTITGYTSEQQSL